MATRKKVRRELNGELMLDLFESSARMTAAGIANTWHWARQYRSRAKVHIDKWFEPLVTFTAANTATIVAADYALDSINRNLDEYAAAATLGTYILSSAALVELNSRIFWPLTKKVFQHHDNKLSNNEQVTLFSWVKTLGLAAAITLYAAAPINKTYENVKYDLNALVTARQTREQVSEPSLETRLHSIEEPPKVIAISPPQSTGGLATGSLEGMVFGDYFGDIIGVKGKVPAFVNIDPKIQMQTLWTKKAKDSSHAIPKVYEQQVTQYLNNEIKPITIDQFLDDISSVMTQIDRELNWDKVKQIKKLDTENQINLVHKLTYTLQPKDLLAISMTEIMPGSDGKRNKKVYDLMLRMGGAEYVYLIPSQNDELASFGPYQHTSHVVRHDHLLGGATAINLGLPEASSARLPGSMYLLQGNQHHSAAYLNATNNFATLVRKLSRSQFGKLAALVEHDNKDIPLFIALAHHNPSMAINYAKGWLDDNGKYPLSKYTRGRFTDYATKFTADRKALE